MSDEDPPRPTINPFPLILSCGLFCFTLTGPVGWQFTVFAGVAFGWHAGLYYAMWKLDQILRSELGESED